MAPKLLDALVDRRLDGAREPTDNRGLPVGPDPSISGEVPGADKTHRRYMTTSSRRSGAAPIGTWGTRGVARFDLLNRPGLSEGLVCLRYLAAVIDAARAQCRC